MVLNVAWIISKMNWIHEVGEMTKKQRSFIIAGFMVYLLMLIWVVLFHGTLETFHSAFDPDFRTINIYLYFNGRESILNMMIFVPLGLYLGVLCEKQASMRKIGTVIAASLLFEMIQYIFAVGATDIMDLINNSIGGGAGLAICLWTKKLLKARFYQAAGVSSVLCTFLILAVALFVPLR